MLLALDRVGFVCFYTSILLLFLFSGLFVQDFQRLLSRVKYLSQLNFKRFQQFSYCSVETSVLNPVRWSQPNLIGKWYLWDTPEKSFPKCCASPITPQPVVGVQLATSPASGSWLKVTAGISPFFSDNGLYVLEKEPEKVSELWMVFYTVVYFTWLEKDERKKKKNLCEW